MIDFFVKKSFVARLAGQNNGTGFAVINLTDSPKAKGPKA